MKKYMKYIFEVLAIFLAITLSFSVEEWREERQNREETIKALEMIRFDLSIDTNYYHMRLARLEQATHFLKPALDGALPNGDVLAFRKVLYGLRVNADYSVKMQGIEYLRNNIRLPSMKNDSLLTEIGFYYDLSTGFGNYSLMNKEHFKLSGDNYYKMYEFNPHYLDEDTSVSHTAIRNTMEGFLQNPYWVGRINLMHRENSRTMKNVFEKNLNFAESIMVKIDKELDFSIKNYRMSDVKE